LISRTSGCRRARPIGRLSSGSRFAKRSPRRASGARLTAFSSAASRWADASPRISPPRHLAAQGLDALSGVVCFGYPLHPPGKPQQLRIEHLPSIAVPVLVIQGERDTFGTPAELRPHLEAMQADVRLHVIPRGDHSLSVRGKTPAETQSELAEIAAAFIAP
jgi:pimeloyl-ACP methyl ester carboxylesterase